MDRNSERFVDQLGRIAAPRKLGVHAIHKEPDGSTTVFFVEMVTYKIPVGREMVRDAAISGDMTPAMNFIESELDRQIAAKKK
jgi:hypothetical protein